MDIKTFETVLPIFTGFYESIFEDFTEYGGLYRELENNTELTIEQIENIEKTIDELDTQKDMETTAEMIVDAFAKCEEFKRDFIKGWKFENLKSPKFYNYSTDEIYCKVTVDIDEMKKYYDEVRTSEEFDKFLKDTFTSCDGFTSFFSNSPDGEEWQEIDNENIHYILDFIYRDIGEESNEMILYYAMN